MSSASKCYSLFLFVIFVVSSLIMVNPSEANPSSLNLLFDNVVITVQSPQNAETYNVTTLPLYFTVETNNPDQLPTRYILNSQSPVDVPAWVVSQTKMTSYYGTEGPNNTFISHPYNYARYTAQGTTVLNNLSNGKYILTVERYYVDSSKPQGIQLINSTSISFTIDTANQHATPVFYTPPAPYPKLTFGSFNQPKNIALNNNPYANVGFSFNLNVIPSWVGYSIDGGSSKTISNLDTIINIETSIAVPLGSHTVTIYANDTAGNWATPITFYSTVVSFKDWISGHAAPPNSLATTPSDSSSPTPIEGFAVNSSLVIVSVIVVTVLITITVLVYVWKKKVRL